MDINRGMCKIYQFFFFFVCVLFFCSFGMVLSQDSLQALKSKSILSMSFVHVCVSVCIFMSLSLFTFVRVCAYCVCVHE